MNTPLLPALATAASGPAAAFFTPAPGVVELFAMGVVLGVALWTFRQYDQPRRFIELPSTETAPDVDDRGDESSERRVFRDAA